MSDEEFEALFGKARFAWYRLTPAERMERSAKLCERYLAADGSLGPHYDPSDPMHETYLADGIYELGSIPDDLVREEVDFESLIKQTRTCDSLEAAQLVVEKFRRDLEQPKT